MTVLDKFLKQPPLTNCHQLLTLKMPFAAFGTKRYQTGKIMSKELRFYYQRTDKICDAWYLTICDACSYLHIYLCLFALFDLYTTFIIVPLSGQNPLN